MSLSSAWAGKREDAARLHMQMERIFRAVVTFENRREWSKSYVDMQITPKGTLWRICEVAPRQS